MIIKKTEHKLKFGGSLAAVIIAIISGVLFLFIRYLTPLSFPPAYYLISSIIMAILLITSRYFSEKNLTAGFILMILSLLLAITNDVIFIVINFWILWSQYLLLFNIILISIFALIGLNLGNMAEMWKSSRNN